MAGALWALAAYVFIAPNVDLATGLQWHDGQRLAQLGLLTAALLPLLAPSAARALTDIWVGLRYWIRTALLAAFALGLASGILAPLVRWALLEWSLHALLLILALMVATERRRFGGHLDQWLVLLFFATATAYTVTTMTVYAAMLLQGPAYGQGFNVRELYTGFSNVRFFGQMQTMLLPFLLLPALWWGSTPSRKILLWLVPVVWWMLAVGSGTRGTWGALLVGGVAVLIFGGKTGRQWITRQFICLLFGLAFYAVFILLIPQLEQQPAEFLHRTGDIVSLSMREVLWATSAGFATHHPLLGIGPMHYAYFATEVGAHPHNAVLQWAAEWGIPAALLLTGVCAAAGLAFAGHVRRSAAQGEDCKGMVEVALLAALSGAAAQAMVDGVLVMPVSQTVLVLLCGWAMGAYFSVRHTARGGLVERAVMLAVVLFAVGSVAYGVAPEIGRLAEREEAYLTRMPGKILLPRFWAQGWIAE